MTTWRTDGAAVATLLLSILLAGCPADDDPVDLDPLDRQPCPGIGTDTVFARAGGGDLYGQLRAAGDLDGDGCADVMLSDDNDATNGRDAGAVHVFYPPLAGTVFVEQAHARLLGEGEDDDAGRAATGVGDTDGDGFDDLLIGAPGHPLNEGPGAAYLVRGPVVRDVELADADAKLTGEDANDQAGGAVAGAGDVDGDGLADLLVGARYADGGGRAYLLYGPVAGDLSLADADARLLAGADGGKVGEAVAGAGDVDGDGFDDLLIGAPSHEGVGHRSGAAYLVRGPVSGDVDLTLADARLLGIGERHSAGAAVAGAGDLDGDGLDDVLIGAPDADGVGDRAGAVYLLLGPLAGDLSLADADATLAAVEYHDNAGYALDGGGDVDGDGHPDVIVGAPGANAAYLLYGPLAGTISLGDADMTWQSAAMGTGTGVALVGDTDGDGHDDVALSAPAGGPASGPGWWAGAAYLFPGH